MTKQIQSIEDGLKNAELLLTLNLTTFDTIGYLVKNIKEKIEEAKEEGTSEAVALSLFPLKNFCAHIEAEIDKAVNFYNIKEL